MPPPETPQEYYEYFHQQSLYAEPSTPKWSVGLTAARLWLQYHESDNANTDTLISLVRVLMPYRYAGSGFYGLWTTIIHYLRHLPVSLQAPIWLEVFNENHHGERLVSYADQAGAVIQKWLELADTTTIAPVDLSKMNELVEKVYPYFATSGAHEWMALTYAIDAWFDKRGFEPSFIDLVIERHNQAVSR
jgi:hypothetical protein